MFELNVIIIVHLASFTGGEVEDQEEYSPD